MINRNQNGAVSGLAISEIMTILLLLGAIGFGGWAFSQRQDYKNNVDAKIATATDAARQAESAAKTKEFLEKEKSPLKTYNGPEAYGSLAVSFPKTWSGYVDASGTGAALVDAYFSPGVVPSISGQQNSVFALRIQVLAQPYSQILETLKQQQLAGKLTVTAYSLPKLPKVVGVLLSGQLPNSQKQQNVTMVILPLRSQTIELSTEGSQYVSDFNASILPNFSFTP